MILIRMTCDNNAVVSFLKDLKVLERYYQVNFPR